MSQVIIYSQDTGVLAIVFPTEEALSDLTIEEIAEKDIPVGCQFQIIDASDIPGDRTFRNAWEHHENSIHVNIDKAKVISHDLRRSARAAEFAPLDIEATIPAKSIQAEAARQSIRDKYAAMQAAIESSATVEELKQILP